MAKKELRKKAKEQRETLNIKEISSKICKTIKNIKEYKEAQDIAIFYPKEIEINLLDLCKDSNKNFYLPKIKNKTMDFYKFASPNELTKGAFDIYEPKENILAHNIDIIFTPALMVDLKGYRLGWGRGFYDKYLANKNIIKICPIPDAQITEELPCQDWDIPCDMIVSEKRIINIKQGN